MDSMITFLNTTGKSFVGFSTSMLIQSSVLIIVLLVLDAFLRKKVREVLLYGIWMLILVKLVLPTTLSSPIGLGYWIGDKVPSIITEKASSIPKQIASILQRTKPVDETIPYGIVVTDLSSFGTSPELIAGTSPELIADTTTKFTVAASPATASLSWQGFAFLGWLAVVIAMVLLLIRRMFFVKGLLAKSKNPNDSMVDIFERCRTQMGVHSSISLKLSPVAVSPSACGLFRPTILIPQNLPRKLKAGDLKSILLHELAHIKRGDVWVSLIQTILQIAYFYNPLLWVANVIIRKVREQAVDEMVLVAMGEQAEDYPETLLNISRMTFGRPILNLRLIGVVESKKALERRIMNMLNRPVPKSSKLGYLSLIAIVAIGSVILPMGYNPVEKTALAASFMKERSEGGIIIPGRRVGEYTLGMSKDEVLRKLGEPETIFYGEERYTLDNLPRTYFMSFNDVSFMIDGDAVAGIGVHSPLYKFTNGLGVGDSEEEIKQAFGDNFHIREFEKKDFLNYKDKGLQFEIRKKDRTVLEIGVSPIESSKSYKGADIIGKIIVPGQRVGEYTLGMSKEEVMKKLGEPGHIHLGGEQYTLNNLPRKYIMSFGDISFGVEDDTVKGISVRSPLYKFANGLGVGNSEEEIKRAFGNDFELGEYGWKNQLNYEDKGIQFEIRNENKMVIEIDVYLSEGNKKTRTRPQMVSETQIIIPGERVGSYTIGMSKDDVLRKMGEPKAIQLEEDGEVIQRGEERYNLKNLPSECLMIYSDISFGIEEDSVEVIMVRSSLYKLSNGLAVGELEQKVKQAFGKDFKLEKALGKDFHCYHDRGLAFEINEKNQTVAEIVVYKPEGDRKAHIPPTSYINEQGRIVDKTDYPFVNDPKVVGGWKTVDFVREIHQFNPHKKSWRGTLWLNHIIFKEGGTMPRSNSTWTKGLVLDDDTASKYIIKEIDGSAYMFYEWKSGDYTIRHRKPAYYVLKKVLLESLKYEPKYGKKANIVDKIIVPGVRVGEYTLGISKDEVLEELGEPESIQLEEDGEVIRRGEEKYNLNNLPREFIMTFGNFSFVIEDDLVNMIFVRSPIYKLSKELGVGDSEQRIKQVFGDDFQLEEALGKDYLCYHTKGLAFEIDEKKQTIAEIVVYKPEGDSDDPDVPDSAKVALIRQAAADGRISYKLTTPDEFKAIAGRPTREWTESDDEIIHLKYPGIQAKFFGKPELWPHTLVHISCEEGRIDIGQDRPITLRNEKDLDKFGTFWGYSSVDLSRLDLSQKGELLKKMPFDSRTVWPEPARLPPDFDPKAVLEWGKYPGLRVKQLHDQGIKGKGVHVAIIDQPLLLGHIEYRDQLVSYKEIETGNADPQMHGPPVASILVGKTCGVAPEAILHYWAEPSWKRDYKYRCMALEQIMQYNRGKEKSEQIRVVSVSKGFSPSEPNLDRWKALLEEAKKSGIYLVHCGSMGFGAGCRFMKDSDNPANYRLCSFYGGDVYRESGTFFTPIDHRTTASHRARDAYTFWTRSGLSWGAPYYAGVVALGIQVNPNLRPDQIDKLLYDSGWDFQKGKLINPVGFVEAAQKAD